MMAGPGRPCRQHNKYSLSCQGKTEQWLCRMEIKATLEKDSFLTKISYLGHYK